MRFILAAIIASAAAALTGAAPQPRQDCPDATRFGILSISPTTVSAGDTLSVNANFQCAIQLGYVPLYTDYHIEVPVNNNGYEPPILLARRTLAPGATADSFTVQVPDAYYFSNTSYTVMLDITYPVNGTNGIPFYVVGGVGAGITINV